MGQVFHGCATTTEAVRRAIQRSQESLRVLAKHYGINQDRREVEEARVSRRSAHQAEGHEVDSALDREEAIVIAFRRHTLLLKWTRLLGPID